MIYEPPFLCHFWRQLAKKYVHINANSTLILRRFVPPFVPPIGILSPQVGFFDFINTKKAPKKVTSPFLGAFYVLKC